MFYERKNNEIITEAIDIMGDNISFAVTDDKMLVDDGHTYVNAGFNGVDERWNDKMISEIVLRYGCKLQDREIVHKIFGDNIEGAIMAMIQAVTAVETYLYFMNITEGEKMTDQQKLKQKDRLIELLYQTLKEIKDINDAIMSDTDDEFKAVDVAYLTGFIDAKFSAVEEFIRDCYQGDSK